MKRAFSKIDEKRQNLVRKEVFFQILEVLDVKLEIKDTTAICKKWEKNGYIPYQDVIRYLHVSLESGDWEVKKTGGESAVRNARKYNTICPDENERDYDEKSITPSVFDNVWRRS